MRYACDCKKQTKSWKERKKEREREREKVAYGDLYTNLGVVQLDGVLVAVSQQSL